MLTLFRIFVERTSDAIEVAARTLKAHGIQNFTMVEGIGYYNGMREASLEIQILASPTHLVNRVSIYDTARELRQSLEQVSVIVTESTVDGLYQVSAMDEDADVEPSSFMPVDVGGREPEAEVPSPS